ncbi:MAG: TetR/AcrR family transcriptional regulator [Actinomyces ruminicola]|uniref:Transcriptional regulator, TetR family n=1 Tax=Actinomyces ruminicola TaxID=332524 RepID=A0A1G9SST5_9ACTO|nr:TetR/AcrR family transcriptional regulator [Actinomyces ruminicola]SDM38473.1 transcriptional regulator, TetR family [Actinomyces ruminicola]
MISTVVNKRRGRPSGPSNTRERILAAARDRFEHGGYAHTSLRSIAAQADVDHSLITYYFGSKEGLFRAVAELALSPAQGFDLVAARVPPEHLAQALLRSALSAWDRPGYRDGLARLFADALTSEAALRVLREYLHTEMIGRLTEHIGGADAGRRAATAATLFSGLFLTRYLLQLEPVASLPADDVVAQLTPALRSALAPRGLS